MDFRMFFSFFLAFSGQSSVTLRRKGEFFQRSDVVAMVFRIRKVGNSGIISKELGIEADLVLGMPHDGVMAAAEVAHVLGLPLDVLVVRKAGHPLHREFAVGALAENDVVVLDEALLGKNPMVRAGLREVVADENDRLRSYQTTTHSLAGALTSARPKTNAASNCGPFHAFVPTNRYSLKL
jgi:hypothetical protein